MTVARTQRVDGTRYHITTKPTEYWSLWVVHEKALSVEAMWVASHFQQCSIVQDAVVCPEAPDIVILAQYGW